MQIMKATVRIIIITIIVSLIGGCNTYQWWRDSYMGRTILEPQLSYARVERDGNGNPILPIATTPRFLAKETQRYD